jgi:hypothetical protein
LIPKFASELPQTLANFGIGALILAENDCAIALPGSSGRRDSAGSPAL